jgi:F0F1-type ATP synthase assembly protein I
MSKDKITIVASVATGIAIGLIIGWLIVKNIGSVLG